MQDQRDRTPEDSRVSLFSFKNTYKPFLVEWTHNWYWLVDALIAAGLRVQLVNTTTVVQYSGLKRINDRYDVFYLTHLMRSGILPTEVDPIQVAGS